MRKIKIPSKTLTALAVIIVLILALGIGYVKFIRNSSSDVTENPPPQGLINLNPPTQEELNETTAHKDALTNENQQPVVTQDGKVVVNPVITSATESELRAYVDGVAEDGGDCIATFKQGSNSFQKQSKSFMNVSTTNCQTINYSRGDFISSGEWIVTLNYISSNAIGESAPIKLEIK